MAPPKGKGKRFSQNYIDDEDEPGEKQAALNDRIVQFFEVIFQNEQNKKLKDSERQQFADTIGMKRKYGGTCPL